MKKNWFASCNALSVALLGSCWSVQATELNINGLSNYAASASANSK